MANPRTYTNVAFSLDLLPLFTGMNDGTRGMWTVMLSGYTEVETHEAGIITCGSGLASCLRECETAVKADTNQTPRQRSVLQRAIPLVLKFQDRVYDDGVLCKDILQTCRETACTKETRQTHDLLS